VLLGIGGGIFVLIAIVVAVSPSKSSDPTAVTQQTQAAAAPAHSAAPAKAAAKAAPKTAGKTVATFTGSGTQKTAQFTASSTWKLAYSFDCSTFGYKGNFVVFEDGGSDFSGVTVTDLALSKSATTYAYNDAGTHYLEINSECSWTAKVIDEG
jgi:hypothetical protein